MNRVGCNTGNCTGSVGGLTGAVDGWVAENSVEFFGLGSLTQSFNLVFPVAYTSLPQKLLQVTISLIQPDGKIGGVFRINGSSST